jgi:hypothetical protein
VPIEQSEKNTDKLGLYAKLVGGVWDSKRSGRAATRRCTRASATTGWPAAPSIHVFSKVVNKEGKEKLAYETICYWHPGEKQTKFLSFGTGGNLFEGTSTFKDDSNRARLGQPRERWHCGRLQGNDHTHRAGWNIAWIVFRKVGQEWKQIMDSTYTREK